MGEIVLRDPQLKANPYPLFARLRRESPVCRTRGVTRYFWLVTRYDDVVFVLKDAQFAANRKNAPVPGRSLIEKLIFRIYGPIITNMLGADEPDHGRLRGLVHQAFTMRRVEQLRTRVEALTNEYLDRAGRREQWDIVSDYALPLPVTIIAEMLGVPDSDRARFHKWSDTLVQSFGSSLRRMLANSPNIMEFLRYIRSMVRLRRKRPQDDLISALVMAEEAGDKLTEDELVSMILLLLVAGHETTVNLIGNGTLALLENPEQMEKLRANPALIPLAVEEFARYYSPVDYANTRWTRCDISIGGIVVPKGQGVLASLSSANRDESKFERPDVLDIAREPNRHLAFGQGAHHCLGVFLARLEAQVAFTTLLRRCPELRLAVPRESLRWRPSFLMRGLQSLPVSVSTASHTSSAAS
jgi:cytochrome P450 PksS